MQDANIDVKACEALGPMELLFPGALRALSMVSGV